MKKLFLSFLLICSALLGFAQADCPATMADSDGNVYRTLRIGSQCWMAENMRSTLARNGNPIALGNGASNQQPLRYCPNGRLRHVARFGYLYNWPAALLVCPNGWHLPSDAEWTQLTDFVGSQSGYCCDCCTGKCTAKAFAAADGWKRCSEKCTIGHAPTENNGTGFGVLPAGGFYGSAYGYFGKGTFLWSATASNNDRAYKRYFDYNAVEVGRTDYFQYGAGGVRCVKD